MIPQEQSDESALAAPSADRCSCDFCSGRKALNDNWCSYCAEVKMVLPKWWENMDLCDACEKLHREDPERFWGGGRS